MELNRAESMNSCGAGSLKFTSQKYEFVTYKQIPFCMHTRVLEICKKSALKMKWKAAVAAAAWCRDSLLLEVKFVDKLKKS